MLSCQNHPWLRPVSDGSFIVTPKIQVPVLKDPLINEITIKLLGVPENKN
jgi:hypothetical protein